MGVVGRWRPWVGGLNAHSQARRGSTAGISLGGAPGVERRRAEQAVAVPQQRGGGQRFDEDVWVNRRTGTNELTDSSVAGSLERDRARKGRRRRALGESTCSISFAAGWLAASGSAWPQSQRPPTVVTPGGELGQM